MKNKIIKLTCMLIVFFIMLILIELFDRSIVQDAIVMLALFLNPDKILNKIGVLNGTNK